MIILHPLQAPSFTWHMMYQKKEGLRLWLKLLRKPMMSPWYKIHHIPWCGWIQFWQARPWRKMW